VKQKGMAQISDSSAIEKIIDDVLTASPQQLESYRNGKETIIGYFVGQVMKASKGQANPAVVNQLLKDKLSKS
jgi:aspartyl-tRNA(Asn)/glutamyl-tRNA(Gln) amidotransferase subunit B